MTEHLIPPNNDQFTWDSIGQIDIGRNNLGDSMPVSIYRLFQFTLKDTLDHAFGVTKTIEYGS